MYSVQRPCVVSTGVYPSWNLLSGLTCVSNPQRGFVCIGIHTCANTDTHTEEGVSCLRGQLQLYMPSLLLSFAVWWRRKESKLEASTYNRIDIIYIPMCSFNCFDISDLFYSLEVSLESARILISQSRGTSYKPLTLAVLVSRSI